MAHGYRGHVRRLALVLTLLLVAAACSARPTQLPTVGGTDGPHAPPTADGPTTAGVPQALAFSADTIEGDPFDGGAYAGQDLMIWFWAPW